MDESRTINSCARSPMIEPSENIITGQWVQASNGVFEDSHCGRIRSLVETHLSKLGSDPSGWHTLYCDPVDGRLWELAFPQSHLHGGGAPELRCLGIDAAIAKYGIILE